MIYAVTASVALASMAGAAASAPSASAATGQVLFFDNFKSGFNTTSTWLLVPASTPNRKLPQGDGIVTTTSSTGLTVVPTGKNPRTGAPAFAATTGPQASGFGSGDGDHLKWVAEPRAAGSTGFAVPATGALTCSSELSAKTEGVRKNPFGRAAVTHPQSDPRLADAALISLDPATEATADLLETNREIWAVYERLPVAGSTSASYQYLIPVAKSRPGQLHTLQIRYDKAGARVTWLVDGHQVLSTDKIGTLAFGRTFLAIDHGGTPARTTVRHVVCGLATADDLDAGGTPGDHNREGLVKLDDDPNFYFSPRLGPPTPQTFIDGQSLLADRLFGQGVTLNARFFKVSDSR